MKTYKEINYCDLKTAGKENFYEVKSVLNLDLIRPSGKNEILGRKRKDYLAKETWIQKIDRWKELLGSVRKSSNERTLEQKRENFSVPINLLECETKLITTAISNSNRQISFV